MKNVQPDGASSQLDIRIDEKIYANADGTFLSAVSGFELAVARTDFIALFGPSGCGKTTILRILAGLDSEFSGAITWNMAPHIGFVFQEPQLLPWRTVRQNIELVRREKACQTGGDKLADIDRLAQDVGISNCLDQFPGELSLGLARRVAIARAFACEPNVLLLDEPFVSLDEPSAQRLRQLLLRVWASRPVTAFLVTHNLREALQLADRLVLLGPRPTKVVADIPVNIARKDRSERRIEDLRAKLRTDYPAFFAEL